MMTIYDPQHFSVLFNLISLLLFTLILNDALCVQFALHFLFLQEYYV